MKKRMIPLLLVLAMLVSIAPATVFALSDKESNNTAANAQSFNLGDTINGSITLDDVDMYSFKLTKSGRVTLDFTSYIQFYCILLYDSTGTELWQTNHNEWNSTVGFRKDVHTIDLETGTYYLKVNGYRVDSYNASTGTYSMKTSFTASNANEKESNNSAANANSIILGNTVKGLIAENDRYDFYQFEISESGRVTLDFTSYIQFYCIFLYDATGTELWQTNHNEWNSTVGFRNDVHTIDLEAGTYYLKVNGYRVDEYNASTGTYSMKTSFTASNATEKEDNNSVANANPVFLGSVIKGLIGANDRYDFYRFTIPKSGYLPFSVTSYMQFYSLYLYDETGSQVWYDDNNEWNSTTGFRTDDYNVALNSGTYYLKVTGYRSQEYNASTGNYTIRLNLSFTDVVQGQWFYDDVMWAVDNNITAGTGGNKFSPNQECTREQVVTFLWRAAGSPEPTMTENPFKDVEEDKYYSKAVLWAVENKITAGTGGDLFSPKRVCTRAEVVTFLHRAAKTPAPSSANNPFTDVENNKFYTQAVLWAVGEGITSGTSKTTFSPMTICDRAQTVSFLSRAYGEK